MLIAFRNLLVNIMAVFIFDRDARHEFRSKYKIKSKLKLLLDDNTSLFNEVKILNIQIRNIQKNLSELNSKRMLKLSDNTIEHCKKFYKAIDEADFAKKYENLIKGLDDESIECVSQILGRITLIYKKVKTSEKGSLGEEWLDVFTDDELYQIDKIRKEFRQQIVRLSDGCFAYKQHMLPVNQFRANVFYHKHDISKLRYLDRIKNKDVIDAGGCIADSAIMFTEFINGKIYTFEPTSVNYDVMLKTIELNQSKNIVPVKLGLGSKEEKLFMELVHRNYGGNKVATGQHVTEESKDYERVSITSLDNFLEGKDIDVGLIKVDVEGYEQEFLKGAYQTIKKYKPSMLISIYHNPSDFLNIKPIIESWDLGYSFKISHPVDGGIITETVLICEQD